MGHTDIISKSLIREIVQDLATYLLGLKLVRLEDLPTEQQRIETRHADIVMRAEDSDGACFLLHLELQNSNDANMGQRMLRYYTDISLSYPDETIRQYVIYIGKAALTMSSELLHPDWRYSYRLIDMHTLDCERFIHEDNPDALVMAILCDFKGRSTQEVLQGIIERLITLIGSDSHRLRRYLKMIETLSVNRNLLTEFKEIEIKMLSEIDIEKLPSYQIGIDKGMEQGMVRGMEQGMERGMVQVARMALQQGMAIESIMQLTGLEREKIERLQRASDLSDSD